ncbi:MAG: biotin--[acetyl-CoA-carboxylase] ligase [Paludibacteraceae bacterium]|nr:biotin--[acetyl-CoA-carboxylase] ligase [Paludibacteraceae bacterium]
MDREDLFCIRTDFQSAGRGQTGNGWESEMGKNLLFSYLLREPDVPIQQQFDISARVCVTLYNVLLPLLDNRLSVKWPNDIYYGNDKLAGILIEHILVSGRIWRTIIGIGINLNQTDFISDAPNPISLKKITGNTYSPDKLMQDYLKEWKKTAAVPAEELRELYRGMLYRKEGFYPYMERVVDVTPTSICRTEDAHQSVFMAEIEDITPQGELVLRTQKGETRIYHFKQIRFVI